MQKFKSLPSYNTFVIKLSQETNYIFIVILLLNPIQQNQFSDFKV
jgi:hypothetical protein